MASLVDHIERLVILFTAPQSELQQLMQGRRVKSTFNRIWRGAAKGFGALKALSITLVEPATRTQVKIGFDTDGTTVVTQPAQAS